MVRIEANAVNVETVCRQDTLNPVRPMKDHIHALSPEALRYPSLVRRGQPVPGPPHMHLQGLVHRGHPECKRSELPQRFRYFDGQDRPNPVRPGRVSGDNPRQVRGLIDPGVAHAPVRHLGLQVARNVEPEGLGVLLHHLHHAELLAPRSAEHDVLLFFAKLFPHRRAVGGERLWSVLIVAGLHHHVGKRLTQALMHVDTALVHAPGPAEVRGSREVDESHRETCVVRC
mmetsp:Transcript_78782/g.139214  ORF Transcript_78782/g.139214 Transcript_78782/m.139214 type:complete len:229 (+) Transcript_78782:1210-1896(+)